MNTQEDLSNFDISQLHTNQKLIVEALLVKGATLRMLDKHDELIEVIYNGKKDFLLDRFSSQVPYHAVKMSADKHFTKKILAENNINTPIGNVFSGYSIESALKYADGLYPVVIKPNWGSHGDHVRVDIRNEEELTHAITEFMHNTGVENAFIIEQYHPWKEYRLFVTKLGGFAVVHRQCSSIVGDGEHTIQELVEQENRHRLDLKKQVRTSICPIVIDEEVSRYLLLQNVEEQLDYIPKKDEQVFLRNESNLAKGGKAIDMTDLVHDSVKELANKVLACFPGLPVAGLDLLCEDITKPLNNYVIIEVNSNPGLAMHTYPTEGKSRNVAQLLLEVMFPDIT